MKTTRYGQAASALIAAVRPRSGQCSVAGGRQPAKQLSSAVAAIGRGTPKSHAGGTGSSRVGKSVGSVCQTRLAAKPRIVAVSRGKNGCQPRPNGESASPVLRIVSVSV